VSCDKTKTVKHEVQEHYECKQLDEARNATKSTWGDVKAGFKKGYSELKDGFQQARQWVSDKVAP